jgi:hypothetical protein
LNISSKMLIGNKFDITPEIMKKVTSDSTIHLMSIINHLGRN